MLITTGEPRTLGLEHDSWLRFGEVEPGVRRPPTGDRYLVVEDQAAFELSYWTGTCEFLFTRLWGANQTGSIEELQATLSAGLTRVEDRVIERFGALLPQDDYLPLLQRIEPRIIWPGKGDDYFTNECLDTWEIDAFWGLPLTLRRRTTAPSRRTSWTVPSRWGPGVMATCTSSSYRWCRRGGTTGIG